MMQAHFDMLDEADYADVPSRADIRDDADLADIPAAHTSPLKVVLGLTVGAAIGLLVAKVLLWTLLS
jgi:hypothetical protein